MLVRSDSSSHTPSHSRTRSTSRRTASGSSASFATHSASASASASVNDQDALTPRYTPPRRTLDDVRRQVAQEMAIHTITKAETLDGVKIGVRYVTSKTDDIDYLRQIVDRVQYQFSLTHQPYIFVFANVSPSAGIIPTPSTPTPVSSSFTTRTSPLGGSGAGAGVGASSHSHIHSPSLAHGSAGIVAMDRTEGSISSSSLPLAPLSPLQPHAPHPGSTTLIIISSTHEHNTRAILLTTSKFLSRIARATEDHHHPYAYASDEGARAYRWYASVFDLGATPWDEEALWDVVKKSARAPINPLYPPPNSLSAHSLVLSARAHLQRITPRQAHQELLVNQVGAPTFLVDIRSAEERERYGVVRGSVVVERNELEWRFDPREASGRRLEIVDRYDLRILVFDQEGEASSLAAYSLQQIGMLNATDIIGGFSAWKEDGLPTSALGAPTRSPQSLAGDLV